MTWAYVLAQFGSRVVVDPSLVDAITTSFLSPLARRSHLPCVQYSIARFFGVPIPFRAVRIHRITSSHPREVFWLSTFRIDGMA